MNITIVRLLLVLSVVSISCVEMRETFRTEVNSEFALRVGSIWTYAHYDSLSRVGDTITTLITSEKEMGGGSHAYNWQYTSQDGNYRFSDGFLSSTPPCKGAE